jgi:hypothetical protein
MEPLLGIHRSEHGAPGRSRSHDHRRYASHRKSVGREAHPSCRSPEDGRTKTNRKQADLGQYRHAFVPAAPHNQASSFWYQFGIKTPARKGRFGERRRVSAMISLAFRICPSFSNPIAHPKPSIKPRLDFWNLVDCTRVLIRDRNPGFSSKPGFQYPLRFRT